MAFTEERRARLNAIADSLNVSSGPKQNTGLFGDLGTDLKRGIQGIPSALTGLADIPINLLGGDNYISRGADYLGDATGFNPDEWARQNQQEYSAARQEDIQNFANVDGFGDSAGYLLRNPGFLLGTVTESLPSMVAGGAIGKALGIAGKLSGIARAGAGEGAISAGQQMSGLAQQGADPQAAALASLGTGVVVGAVGGAGGTLSRRMGLLDPDLLVAGVSQKTGTAGLSIAARMALGAGQEGGEEFIQSGAEQVLSNVALGNPVTEGLGKAAVSGALAGGVMGGALNIRRAPQIEKVPPTPEEEILAIDAVGGNAERGAKKKLLGLTRKEDVQTFLKHRPKAREAVLNSAFYKALPTNAEWRAAKAAAEKEDQARAVEAAATDSAVADEIKIQQAAGPDPESVAASDKINTDSVAAILSSGVLDAALNDTSDADAVRAAPSDLNSAGEVATPAAARATRSELPPSLLEVANAPMRMDKNGVFQKDELDGRGSVALAGYISGNTPALVEKYTKAAYASAIRDVATAKSEFRSSLSSIIGARGRVKPTTRVAVNVARKGKKRVTSVKDAPIDPELKAFVEQVLKLPNDVRLPRHIANAINKTALGLSVKHKMPELRKSTGGIVGAINAVGRAYAPEVATRPVKNTARRSEDPFDKSFDNTSLRNLFDNLHALTREFDKARGHLAKRTTGRLTAKKTLTSGVFDVSPDLDVVETRRIAALRAKDTRTKSEEAEIVAQGKKINTAISMANIAAQGGAGTNVEGLYALADSVEAQLRRIEMRVGRDNLLAAQSTGIVKTGKGGAARRSKAGKQEGEAVRFNVMYNAYRNGGINLSVEDGPIRHTRERTKKDAASMAKAGVVPEMVRFSADGSVTRKKGQLTTRVEEIIEEQGAEKAFRDTAREMKLTPAINKGSPANKRAAREKVRKQLKDNPKSYPPLQILLESLGVRMSPSTALMANHLRAIMQQSMENMTLARTQSIDPRTLAFDDYISRIDLEIHPESSSGSINGKGTAVGAFNPADPVTGNPTIRLWQMGTSPRTILHEVLHAVVAGIIASPEAQTSNQKALIADLEALRADAVTQYDAEKAIYDVMWAELRSASKIAKEKGIKMPPRSPESVRALRDQRRLVQVLEILKSEDGDQEFITYGMTEPALIAWMKTRRAPAGFLGNKPDVQGKSWWGVFAHKIKLLLGGGIAAVKDSLFESFVDASAGLLGEVYVASDAGNKIFSFRQGAAEINSAPDMFTVASFVGYWKGAYSPEDVAAAAGDHDTGQDSIKRSAAQSRKAANDEKLVAAAETEKVKLAVEAKYKKKGETATPQRANSRDITYVDKLERMMLNGLTNFGTGGRYTDYQRWAQERLLDRSGKGIVKSMENKNDRWLVTAVGKLLSKTVDQFGTPVGFRNIMHNLSADITGGLNIAYGAYESTVSFTDDMQLGIIDYIYDRNEDGLRAKLGDDSKADTVLKVIGSLEETLAAAKRIGRVHPSHIDDNLAEFLDLQKGGSFVVKSKANIGVLRPVSMAKNRLQVAGISEFSLVAMDGTEITPQQFDDNPELYRNKRFMHGKNTPEGHDIFIEQGADYSVWDIYKSAPAKNQMIDDQLESRPYKLNGAANSIGEFTLSRQKTPQEHRAENKKKYGGAANSRSDKERAVVMSALTELMQDWNHSIEGYMATQNMLSMQDGLVTEDGLDERFILDATPENQLQLEAEIPTSRLFDFRKQDDATSKNALSMLRIPGSWVRLPDDSSTTALMGDMAGKYVAGPVYMSMRDFYDKAPIIDSETFRAAMSAWKVGKTALSPTAHINNVLGNVSLAYYHDIPPANVATAFKIVAKMMFKPESMTEFEKQMGQEMHDTGITLVAPKTADFDIESTKSLNEFLKEKASSTRGLLKVYTAMETIAGTSLDMYSNQDNVFRLALYMTTIQNDAGFIESGAATQELKQYAAQLAAEGFVDYQIHAPWVKAARGTIFPFIAWPYRMVPLMFKTMVTKPWKAVNTIAAITVVNAAAYAFLGADGDDEEYERSVQPEWYQKSISWLPGVPTTIRLPFGTPGGDSSFLSISRAVPLADITDFSGSGIPSIINMGGPAGIIASILMNHDPFTGDEITNGTEDVAGWMAKEAAFLAKGAGPGFATNIARFAKRQGEMGPLGEEYDFWIEAARALGVSVFQMNVPEAAYSKDINRRSVEREFKIEIGRMWRRELRKKDPDFDATADAEIRFQERMLERMQNLDGGFASGN